MTPPAYREGYLYRYAQGPTPQGKQVPPRGVPRETTIAWAQGWTAAHDDHAKGTPSRFPLPPPVLAPVAAPEPPSEPARPPRMLDPEPEAPEAPKPAGPRVVSVVKRPGIEAAPRTPRVVPVEAPESVREGIWLTVRIRREGSMFRVESEGADEELQGNALPALLVQVNMHLAGRFGCD